MVVGTITTKGRITIPRPVRDRLSLRTGDLIGLTVSEEGTIIIRPRTAHIENVMGKPSRGLRRGRTLEHSVTSPLEAPCSLNSKRPL